MNFSVNHYININTILININIAYKIIILVHQSSHEWILTDIEVPWDKAICEDREGKITEVQNWRSIPIYSWSCSCCDWFTQDYFQESFCLTRHHENFYHHWECKGGITAWNSLYATESVVALEPRYAHHLRVRVDLKSQIIIIIYHKALIKFTGDWKQKRNCCQQKFIFERECALVS